MSAINMPRVMNFRPDRYALGELGKKYVGAAIETVAANEILHYHDTCSGVSNVAGFVLAPIWQAENVTDEMEARAKDNYGAFTSQVSLALLISAILCH